MRRLLHGPPGHPLHPPFTDGAIGAYTVAAVLAVLGAVGVAEEAAGHGMWLALVVGLGFGALAAVTGLLDWRLISRGTSLFRTATAHMIVMVGATLLFAAAAVLQWPGYEDGTVTTAGLVCALAGFAVLAVGGWIGGSIVYVHGMRVENAPETPAGKAIAPRTGPKERRAA